MGDISVFFGQPVKYHATPHISQLLALRIPSTLARICKMAGAAAK
jgi:hypothetical protein